MLLAGFQSIVRLTLRRARGEALKLEDTDTLKKIAGDPRTLITHANLDPILDIYTCCPKCFMPYPEASSPSHCSRRPTPSSSPCGTALFRTRTIGGTQLSRPVRKYLHQRMKPWVGRLLCLPGIQDVLRARSGHGDDFWDGQAIKDLVGPDGKRYLDGPLSETRLVFGLAVDSFNPYHSKTAKQSVSSTAVYMVCLDLPIHLRYLPEYIYLVGVIPGPTKPSLDEMNHFVALLVEDLLDFWDPGVWYARTAICPSRHLVRAALVPLICDLLAARQVSGLSSHSSTYFCSFCYLTREFMENFDPASWPKRHVVEHRKHAEAWRDAGSEEEREVIFQAHGIRWSELLRLPYWDPVHFTVVDSMHNLYLGIIKTHFRDVWGMDMDLEDGDAATHPTKKPPPRPSAGELQLGGRALLYGTATELGKCSKAVLWYLCEERGLRRAGTKNQLLKTLKHWVSTSCVPIQIGWET